ncbi:MAG: hypothetical protein HY275_17090 [Gemmatimonadetes bacterium]|nr:hypothetical protein [Gemmatimonadota bacterium]
MSRNRIGLRPFLHAAALAVLACTKGSGTGPPDDGACVSYGEPGFGQFGGCATLQARVQLADGRQLPYGSARLVVPFDSSNPGELAGGEASLASAGAFTMRMHLVGFVRAPVDSMRTMLYAYSPYWSPTPFDSVSVTLHVVRPGARVRPDTVTLTSHATPKVF